MEGMKNSKVWDEFLGRALTLVSRSMFNQLT